MYSVRVTTRWHGNTYLNMLVLNVVVTGLLAWQYGRDYLVIFATSTLLVFAIELGLAAKGLRNSGTIVHGVKLPRLADALLHAVVDGPGFCVPAFFVADRLAAGEVALGVGGAGLIVALASGYMGYADWRGLRRLGPDEAPLMSRRAMTAPGAVMLLALLNSACLSAILLMPSPQREHALVYLLSYSLMVMLFYAINYSLGVRMVQLYDHKRDEFTTPGLLWQAAGLTYDSAYEMALLLSPAYWAAFYLGLLQHAALH